MLVCLSVCLSVRRQKKIFKKKFKNFSTGRGSLKKFQQGGVHWKIFNREGFIEKNFKKKCPKTRHGDQNRNRNRNNSEQSEQMIGTLEQTGTLFQHSLKNQLEQRIFYFWIGNNFPLEPNGTFWWNKWSWIGTVPICSNVVPTSESLFQQLFRFFQTRCNPPGQGQGVKKIIHQLIIYLKSRFSKFLHWLLWIFENAYKVYIFYLL